MNNITKIVNQGICTGCGACNICEHIKFQKNSNGFLAPTVDDTCVNCGKCVAHCIYDPDQETE